jgi:regulatory protein
MVSASGSSRSRPTGPTPGSLADLAPDASPEQVARTIVLNSLNRSSKTRAQLAQLLDKRGVSEDVSERVLDRFEELRLIDDEQFAYDWVRTRHEQRHLSKRALASELRRKGVAQHHIDEALGYLDGAAEEQGALAVAQRKARSTVGLAAPVRHRRIMAAVMRKGYSAGTAAQVVRQVLGDSDTEDPSYT